MGVGFRVALPVAKKWHFFALCIGFDNQQMTRASGRFIALGVGLRKPIVSANPCIAFRAGCWFDCTRVCSPQKPRRSHASLSR